VEGINGMPTEVEEPYLSSLKQGVKSAASAQ
jgi:hypothetical protein